MKNLSLITFSFCMAAGLSSFAQYSGIRENLGSNINTSGHTDSGPIITYDGKTMFFKKSGQGSGYDYDIYFSKMDDHGNWTKAQPLEELNNDKITEVEYVYPDGKTMLLSGTFGEESGVFYAFLKDGKWGDLKKVDLGMEMNANSDNLNITLNTKQEVMIISIGGDLYLSFLRDGKWTHVKAIENLNTKGYEYTPFLDYDDKTLYIAGTGYAGATDGEADIFMVTRIDDSWTNWTAPKKVEGVINTDGWDSFFYISPTKDYVYVYSLNEGGGDILRIRNIVPAPVINQDIVQVSAEQVVPVAPSPEEIQTAEELNVQGNEEPDAAQRSVGDIHQELEQVLIYPNPTKGQFNVQLHDGTKNRTTQLAIFDSNLKLIENVSTQNSIHSFDISAMDNGIYFIRITTEGKSEIKKLVLEK